MKVRNAAQIETLGFSSHFASRRVAVFWSTLGWQGSEARGPPKHAKRQLTLQKYPPRAILQLALMRRAKPWKCATGFCA